MKYKILAIIPARKGSKSILDKNIVKIYNKELIRYTFESANESRLLTSILLSTDCLRIKNLKPNNIYFNRLRPKRLSGDNANIIDVIKYETLKMEQLLALRYDYVMLLQPTSPIRKNKLIDRSIKKIIQTKSDSIISVFKVNEPHPKKCFVAKDKKIFHLFKDANTNQPRQLLNKVYAPTGAIYLAKRNLLFKKNTFMNLNTSYILSKDHEYINIDSHKDLILFKFLLKNKKYSE